MRVPVQVLCSLLLIGALPAAAAPAAPSMGRELFHVRCTACHGVNADGNSKLADLMRPRPSNLRTSAMDAVTMHRIIVGGGAAVGRSDQMPAWDQELSQMEIDAIVGYLQGMRRQP